MGTGNKQLRALSSALLFYMVSVVLMLTLLPFNFSIPDQLHLVLTLYVWDFISNVFLFIPIGFLHRLSGRRFGSAPLRGALVMGITLSIVIEFLQFFLPARYTSLADIVANGGGALLGAAICGAAAKHLAERQNPRIFALEMPLTSLIYLLGPLLWLNGLGIAGDPFRFVTLVLLAVFGSGVFAAVFSQRLAHTSNVSRTMVPVIAAGWLLFFSYPALFLFPIPVCCVGLLTFLLVTLQIRLARPFREQRFEVRTARKLVPFFLAYICLLILRTPVFRFTGEIIPLGYFFRTLPPNMLEFGLTELVAAFTLLGYIIAMLHTRHTRAIPGIVLWILLAPLSLSLLSTFARAIPPTPLALAAPFLLSALPCVFGVFIYRLQLSSIRRL